MNWLAWRQYRKQFLVLSIALALYAAIAIPMGLHLWHSYQHGLAICSQTKACGQLNGELFRSGFSSLLNPAMPGLSPIDVAILAMPFLLGMFVGAPLIAREYAEGTNKLIWTRSISRRKWLTVKLLWVLIATAIFAGGFAVLTTWWSRAGNALFMNRFDGLGFTIQDIVPVGYAVFAVALGIMFGAWFKRILLALAVTMGVLLAVQIAVSLWVRPQLALPRHTTFTVASLGNNMSEQVQQNGNLTLEAYDVPGQPGAWILSSRATNLAGQPISTVPKACQNDYGIPSGIPSAAQSQAAQECLVSHVRVAVTYQPADKYWDFQRIETGLYLALSIIPIGATYWLVLKRDA